MNRKDELEKEYARLQEKVKSLRRDLSKFELSEDSQDLIGNECHRINGRLQIILPELEQWRLVDVSGRDDPYLTVCEGAE